MSKGHPRLSDLAVARLLDLAGQAPKPAKFWELLVLSGTRKGQHILLPRHGVVRLGRDHDNWLRFDRDDERGVSQHHAEIDVSANGLTIRDVGSRNGTTVNGKRLQAPQCLKGRDVIELGQASVRLVVVCRNSAPYRQIDNEQSRGKRKDF